ncbi:LytTR family transcriptional regulator DNA-binding domain-containing protein [Marinifilum fragile]|uniref:LytR/AlgR family response regulator transcription factor n=1 Tax=Marinifilum fragile TaxID=570161 RepID=UPI002AA8B600|nr:LytTR family transcriptional regulator DNA-binding domain-containing protein [Marinifilum fragile]
MNVYLIVDHCKKEIADLKSKLSKIEPECKVYHSTTVEDALLLYVLHKPQLVFLEVNLKNENGFELIHGLLELGERPNFAITTKNESFAIKAIRSSAVDYLLKPIAIEDLQFCLNRVQTMEYEEMEKQRMTELFLKLKIQKRVTIKNRVGFEVIKPEEILFCKADRNYTDIKLVDGTSLTTSTTLGSVVQQLTSKVFFRIGRSAVINLDYLKSVNRKDKQCLLSCNSEIYKLPMSPNRVQELSRVLN